MSVESPPAVPDNFTYDPLDFVALQDPFPTYRVLREHFPVYHNPDRQIWALSRFADVRDASRDWERLSNSPSVDLDEMPGVFGPGFFIDLDPPRHGELRNVVRRLFAPKAILALEDAMRANADALIDEFIGRTLVDLATEFAWRMPVAVISIILGFPQADRDRLVALAQRLARRISGDPAPPEDTIVAAAEAYDYFHSLLDLRRKDPRSDVLSQLAVASKGGIIEEREVTGMCYLLFTAGIETTASLLSNALHSLAQRPTDAEFLRRNPDVMSRAIEEFLRLESPVQYLARTANQDIRLHGTLIPKGSRVVLIHGSANRDPARFANPDQLDFHRNQRRTMTFGEGIHFCLGAPLARPEARIALQRFLARVDAFSLKGPAERTPTANAFGYWRLPAEISRSAI